MAEIIKADGTRISVEPKNGKDFSVEELQSIVGGYFEFFYMKHGKIMVVNEEGILYNLPFNRKATKILAIDLFYPNQKDARMSPILGDVLLCESKQIN